MTLLSKVIQDLRDLAKTLNTDFITNSGLINAVSQQLDFLRKTGLFTTQLFISGDEEKFDPYRELVIFRIVQELINNIVKHAEADKINISIDYKLNSVDINVRDNGKGFDIKDPVTKNSDGLGLNSINNRIKLINGTIDFESESGNGTSVTIQLPRL